MQERSVGFEMEPTKTQAGGYEISPSQYLAKSTQMANVLAGVIKGKNLYVVLGGKAYVTVEAWTLLANMLGVHPIVRETSEIEDHEGNRGWQARVEVFNSQGALIGAGESMCCRGEKNWANRDDYALRAMAQTRAISRALRNPLGFVVKLAGYEPTPAEEMAIEGQR